jgi:hypothetical protein
MARCSYLLCIAGISVLLLPPAAESQLPRFEDRTAAAGITVVTNSGSIEKPHILESTANGVLALDYDLDGFVDLFFASAYRLPQGSAEQDERSALYRNNGDGTFTDVSLAAGVDVRAYGHGGCVGDFDADGLPDIYLTILGPNILLRNNGDGTFADVTEEAGVGDPGPSIGATFFDADGDGDQDLFVGNYLEGSWEEIQNARRTRRWRGKVTVMDGPRGLVESRNTFYLNNGDGTFEEATEESGLAVGGFGYSMGVTSFDYDNDGDTDVYVANDSNANRLYSNRGDGTFEEIGTWSGTAYNADGRAQGSMGVGFGDFDGNGWLDLVVTNFAHDYYALYRNLSGQLFQDESFVAKLTAPSFRPLGWGALFLDVDHDRDLDLFFSNGHIYPQVDEVPSLGETYKQRNQLLVNEEGGYREISEQAGDGFLTEESSRGAVYLDVENDGDLDIAVSNQDARPTLLTNVADLEGHWLTIDLVAADGPRQIVGGRVAVAAGGVTQIREVTSGGSYASHNDTRLHLGLGDAASIERLTITWPGGGKQAFERLQADRIYVVGR